MVIRNAIALVLLVLALLAFAGAALSQDATVEAPVLVIPASDAPTGIVPGDSTANPPVVVVQTPDRTPFLLSLGATILFAIVGGGGVLLVIDRLTKSKAAKDSTEMLYESLSPTWQATIHRVLDVAETVNEAAQDLLQFARDVTDGKENTDPPPDTSDPA